MQTGIQILGDWKKEIAVPLRDALAVSMTICGRTGEEACKHAIILMAQSARALTKRAKEFRKELRNPALNNAVYVENWVQGRNTPQKIYKFRFGTDANVRGRIDGTWEDARTIGNRGLAKRSWMWGLAKLKPMSTGKAIPGASRVYSINTEQVSGYIKENRLGYITKIMPAGWESEVQSRVGNKIMGQARNKLEQKWRREMGMPRSAKKSQRKTHHFWRGTLQHEMGFGRKIGRCSCQLSNKPERWERPHICCVGPGRAAVPVRRGACS